MIVCSTCRKEMTCVLTGKRVVWGADHVYSGDEFACNQCGARVVNCSKAPHYDPDVRTNYRPDEILEMP